MSTLSNLRAKFSNNELSKPEYIQKMYETCHSMLFDYATYISQTDVSEIRIVDGQVYMSSRKYGIGMFCPEGDHRVAPIESLNFLGYEEKDSAMILRLIPDRGVVFDIGANMGWYSLMIAKHSKCLEVHSFEPIPKTFEFLQKNVDSNQLNNIKLHNFGFSNESKEIVFYTYPEGSGNASSANLSGREDVALIRCTVELLDDFVSMNKLKVDFIKCDVEGAELFTFLGAEKTIARDNPIVFTEMLRKWSAKFNYHPNEIIDLFKSLGYKCFYVQKNCLIEISKMTDETEETNFFFLHEDKHNSIIEQFSE